MTGAATPTRRPASTATTVTPHPDFLAPLTTDQLAELARREFTAGYQLGYLTGEEVGYGAAEHDMAEAWSVEAAKVRLLAAPDNPGTRVAAAERAAQALADAQWSSNRAWSGPASALGVSVPRLRALLGEQAQARRVRGVA